MLKNLTFLPSKSFVTASSKPTLSGIVFDCDGTIIESALDFAEMYRKVGVPREKDILAEIANWPEDKRKEAHRLIEEMESDALDRMCLMPGAATLGSYCWARRIPFGLVTRNSSSCIQRLHSTHWPAHLPRFQPALARDSGHPPKPDPAALLACAAAWGVNPRHCAMVGDSARDDVAAARRAGMAAVLLRAPQSRSSAPTTVNKAAVPTAQPDAVVESLEHVPAVLEKLFFIPQPTT